MQIKNKTATLSRAELESLYESKAVEIKDPFTPAETGKIVEIVKDGAGLVKTITVALADGKLNIYEIAMIADDVYMFVLKLQKFPFILRVSQWFKNLFKKKK